MEAYQHLDKRVQKWIHKQGWDDLREIQKRAIKPILSGKQDILISASTAAGKTEAVFLPACTAIADHNQGFGILYISPLKALINDQYRRLESLCDMLDMSITAWHGDSSQAKKKQARKNPSGILLITPESLESLLVRKASWVKQAFSSLQYIIIDEFHAFIGTERGQQLLSLLNRIEHLLERYQQPIPRIALSATLGKLKKIPLSLRANQSLPCKIITSHNTQTTLKIQVQGYIDPSMLKVNNTPQTANLDVNEVSQSAEFQIYQKLYKLCRGKSHLIFANSRNRTENIAAQLKDICEKKVVPNEFFPHHGSLAKELREELESRLLTENKPTTAVCTMTLELGIDIGKVHSVIQVTAPNSVSSLRQRTGRSGRRNDPSILRMLITEKELTKDSNIVDKLRMELLQSIAMIRLMVVDKWFEPADTHQMHFSTLLHQILAVTAQWGSIRADQLYILLCQEGSFQNISIQHFKQLLSHMGKTELLIQLSSGELILGIQGERLTNHYTFYAVFKTPQEFRIITGNQTLGTLPLDSPIATGQHIIFGGKRWKALEIDIEKKVIYVTSAKGGQAPKFSGGNMSVHDVIRQEMFKIYCKGDYRILVDNNHIDFIDSTANSLFNEGKRFFKDSNLKSESILQQGKNTYIFTWMGDKVVNTVSAILLQEGFKSGSYAGVIEIEDTSKQSIKDCLKNIFQQGLPSETKLAQSIPKKQLEKYDEFLPETLLNEGYGKKVFNIDKTKQWLAFFQNN